MSEKTVIKATKRDGRGKNDSRRLRKTGYIPVSIYGNGENVAAIVELAQIAAVLRTETGAESVFTIDVEGVGASNVAFRERQIDAVTGRLLHADLVRVK